MRITLKAVLLDVDGTLLDSNDAHARSWVELLNRHRYDCPFAQVRTLIGKGGDKMLRVVEGQRLGWSHRNLRRPGRDGVQVAGSMACALTALPG
ncbi:hypothetical protein QTI66_37980 [Variovorax sp. J22R133]|uniref:HAD hydrolase-like protein n=1 Tax=Variovorax brevis TaxID=3053503 RepID=UPI00257674C5|nr:HAD hydrolase-like protein [Variovorax sp. J22R133]MDM0117883.1 hypothetical protein [Variovorax sp. J22R133]